MRKLDHCNIVRLRYFFYSSGEKVQAFFLFLGPFLYAVVSNSLFCGMANTEVPQVLVLNGSINVGFEFYLFFLVFLMKVNNSLRCIQKKLCNIYNIIYY